MQLIRLLLAALLLCLQGAAAAQDPQPVARQGVIDVPALGRGVVELGGEWVFAWNRFLDPAWTTLPAHTFVPGLGGWNTLQLDGKTEGPDGWGSYALLVRCPAGERYAITVPNQRTAAHVFVNGRLVGTHGDPGASPAAARPAVTTRNPISPEFDCPLRVTVHLSNHSHRTGGMFKAITLGSADALAAQRERRVVGDAALLGAYLLTAALTLAFFAVRREDAAPLLFGLFCLAIAVYADITGERLLLRVLPPELPWEVFLRIEWISWFASLGLFTATIRSLFPAYVPLPAVRRLVATCAVLGLVVLATPGRVYSYLAPAGQVLTGAVVLHATWHMVLAARAGSRGARQLLVGLAAILAAFAADVVLYYFYAPVRRLVPLGAAVFVLMPALLLVQRLARALGAEARTKTLEENARLREDVERMSRHDLKTPLNSILGVARILADDRTLAAGHRELVSIVERAGYRMLEMVNLSLGLFKMETGTYDFRPQAVDLRGIARRVLVDVQAFAEAARVRLEVLSPEADAVYVRGEELLCYSILANIVKNAIEATPAGGAVTVRIRTGDPVRVEVHNPGDMPAGLASRFFQKYATAGKAGGTGLGAYSARLMANAQEGDLRMHTGGGAGTTLTLELKPLTGELPRAESRPPPRLAADPAGAQHGELHVLVVDDDEYNRLILRRYLPSPPFRIDAAVNGEDAVARIRRHWPDCIVVDLEMPVMNGTELVAWVRQEESRQQRAPCRIVMLSSHDDEPTIARCMAAGADTYLTKPTSPEALLAAIRAGFAPGAPVVQVDPDLLDAIPDFLATRRELVEQMDAALARGDREGLRALAHKAGGGLALYGFEAAADRCRELESLAAAAAVDDLRAPIAWLRSHLASVRFQPAAQAPASVH